VIRGYKLVPGAKGREQSRYCGSEYCHGWHSQRAGEVHRATIVAHQNITSLEERHHLAKIELRRDYAFHFAKFGAVTAGVDEGQRAHSRLLSHETRRLAKPLEWPPLLRHARARMDADKDIAR
jgi:aryl-alcohol dehydrogenase-like predicted oxidoreductase